MDLTVNGLAQTLDGDATIDALILEMKAQPDKVAVLVNDEIVPRAQRGAVSLKEGDRVEIITMAGGG